MEIGEGDRELTENIKGENPILFEFIFIRKLIPFGCKNILSPLN
jgi:hypothetical protein